MRREHEYAELLERVGVFIVDASNGFWIDDGNSEPIAGPFSTWSDALVYARDHDLHDSREA